MRKYMFLLVLPILLISGMAQANPWCPEECVLNTTQSTPGMEICRDGQTLCVSRSTPREDTDRCGECPADSCGDQSCDGDETCSSCPEDCGPCEIPCGNEICSEDETCSSCPEDCGPCEIPCGNETCGPNEDCESCPEDCGECPIDPCGDQVCDNLCPTGEASECGTETCETCPEDCGTCEEPEVPDAGTDQSPDAGTETSEGSSEDPDELTVQGGGCNVGGDGGNGFALFGVLCLLGMIVLRKKNDYA